MPNALLYVWTCIKRYGNGTTYIVIPMLSFFSISLSSFRVPTYSIPEYAMQNASQPAGRQLAGR